MVVLVPGGQEPGLHAAELTPCAGKGGKLKLKHVHRLRTVYIPGSNSPADGANWYANLSQSPQPKLRVCWSSQTRGPYLYGFTRSGVLVRSKHEISLILDALCTNGNLPTNSSQMIFRLQGRVLCPGKDPLPSNMLLGCWSSIIASALLTTTADLFSAYSSQRAKLPKGSSHDCARLFSQRSGVMGFAFSLLMFSFFPLVVTNTHVHSGCCTTTTLAVGLLTGLC